MDISTIDDCSVSETIVSNNISVSTNEKIINHLLENCTTLSDVKNKLSHFLELLHLNREALSRANIENDTKTTLIENVQNYLSTNPDLDYLVFSIILVSYFSSTLFCILST